MKGNVWSLNSLGFLLKKNWSICEIKQSFYDGKAFYHSILAISHLLVGRYSSPVGHYWLPQQPDWAGKVFRLWNHWSLFDVNWDPKTSNWSFSKVTRFWFFFLIQHFQGVCLVTFSLQIFRLSALFFIIIAFFWGSVSWVNSKLEGFVPNWNGMKFQIPSPNGRPSLSQGLYL